MFFKTVTAYHLGENLPDAATLAFASQLLAAQSLTTLLNELADHLGGFNEKV